MGESARVLSPSVAPAAQAAARRPRWGLVAAEALLVLAAVYFLLPVYWLLISATKSDTELFAGSGLLPGERFALVHNVVQVVTYSGGIFLRWILNSVLYSGIVAVLGTVISGMAGYVLATTTFPGKRLILIAILTSLMIPAAALVVPTFLLDHALHLLNTYFGVILPLLASPFGVFFMYVYLGSAVARDILDAARVDGASEWRILWSIVPYQALPGAATLALILFIGTWNNFFLPLVVLNNDNLFPVSLGLSVWNATAGAATEGHAVYSLVITGALLSVVPLVVAFVLARRYIIRGLSFSGLVF